MLRTITIGEKTEVRKPWVMNLSDEKRVLAERASASIIGSIEQWAAAYPTEESLAQTRYGVPSLLVRVDMTILPGGGVGLYEIEDRPAGPGVTGLVNSDFGTRLGALRKKWPDFAVVVSPRRTGTDDELWLRAITLEEARQRGTPVLVRAEPHESEFHGLLGQSVSTLTTEGLKSYGVPMGLWQEVRHADVEADPSTLPWEAGFCLKPTRGSKCLDVHVWSPRHKHRGSSTKTKILEVLRSYDSMYLQEFLPPMQWQIEGKDYTGIYRVFFGYDPEDARWTSMGGVWMARPSTLRIHGASDAVTGAVVLE